jgi:hypothetical protein
LFGTATTQQWCGYPFNFAYDLGNGFTAFTTLPPFECMDFRSAVQFLRLPQGLLASPLTSLADLPQNPFPLLRPPPAFKNRRIERSMLGLVVQHRLLHLILFSIVLARKAPSLVIMMALVFAGFLAATRQRPGAAASCLNQKPLHNCGLFLIPRRYCFPYFVVRRGGTMLTKLKHRGRTRKVWIAFGNVHSQITDLANRCSEGCSEADARFSASCISSNAVVSSLYFPACAPAIDPSGYHLRVYG